MGGDDSSVPDVETAEVCNARQLACDATRVSRQKTHSSHRPVQKLPTQSHHATKVPPPRYKSSKTP